LYARFIPTIVVKRAVFRSGKHAYFIRLAENVVALGRQSERSSHVISIVYIGCHDYNSHDVLIGRAAKMFAVINHHSIEISPAIDNDMADAGMT
jgi:hypothetical protein